MSAINNKVSSSLARALEDLGMALSKDVSVLNIADEHVRFSLYRAAVSLVSGDGGVLVPLCAAFLRDPDRVMVGGAAGLLLTRGASSRTVAVVLESAGDAPFVQRRVKELKIFRELDKASAAGEQVGALLGASGWLEESLANSSGSREVLSYLATEATSRAARREASERLQRLHT